MPQAPYQLAMIGFGTVGGGVAAMLRDHAELYANRLGRPIELTRVLVRRLDQARTKAKDQAMLDPQRITDDPDAFFNTDADAVLELAGGLNPAGPYVERALQAKRHVVTANKALLADQGAALFATARQNQVSLAFEASCGGGIPCVTALTHGLMANAIDGLYGILNGTCNFILTEMTTKGRAYADVLAEAQELGYAEADPTLDVGGFDAGQKLSILASLAFGADIPGDAVPCVGIDALDLTDLRFGDELGYDLKLIAAAERDAQTGKIALSTRPCFVKKTALLAQVRGSFNALSVQGQSVGHTMYYGRGAGDLPTASAVLSDTLNVACGAYPAHFAGLQLTPDLHGEPDLMPGDELTSRWYLRLPVLDTPGCVGRITTALGERGISLTAVLQHEPEPEQDESHGVPLVITTDRAPLGTVEQATKAIAALPNTQVAGTKATLIRILDLAD